MAAVLRGGFAASQLCIMDRIAARPVLLSVTL